MVITTARAPKRRPSRVSTPSNRPCGVIEDQSSDRSLNATQRRVLLQERADRASIQSAIALCAWRPDSGAFAAVQHPELQRRQVRGATHDSAKRIDFANDRALRNAADSRVARHLTNALERTRDQSNACAKTSGGHSGFGSRVATADDEDVEVIFNGS